MDERNKVTKKHRYRGKDKRFSYLTSQYFKIMELKNTYKNIAFCALFIFAISLFCGCNSSVKEDIQYKNPNGRNDSWGYVGAGGGGGMFSPAISPHNPNVAFVGCDMTSSFATVNGGESWRMFNLRSKINFYVFDPLDSNVVYANSIALFKSTDRGNTWSLCYPNPSETKGVVSKGDHGSELIVTKDKSSRKVLALAIDPDNSNKLYASISINNSTDLFISDDGGIKWNKEKELEDGVKNIFIDSASPKNNRTIFIAGEKGINVRENGLWKINNTPKGVGQLTAFSGGFDKKQNKFIIYSISGNGYFNRSEEKSGIFYSENGGETWENRHDGIFDFCMPGTELPEWRTIATSAFNPNVVYVSYNNMKIHKDTTCIGVARSSDFGKTWKLVWKDKITKNGDKPSDNFKGGWLNDRFGATWGENPFCIAISPTDPEICFTTDFGRTIKTTNGGETWKQVYTKGNSVEGWTSRGLEVTTSYNVIFDPFDEKHAFIALTDIGLFESKDGALSWASATKNNGVPANWVNTCYWLTFDPEVKGKAWAVMSKKHDLPRPKMWRRNGLAGYYGGILLTENGGESWQAVSSDIGEAAMTHIIIDPTSDKNARTLYACAFGKGVYKSVDGGKTWVQKNKGIVGKEPFAWQIERRENDGALFLIISRRSEDGSIGNDKDGAIYKSVNGAESWTEISLPKGSNAPTSLILNNSIPKKLVLSAWGRKTQGQFTPDIGGGIFISDDEGETWKQVMSKDQHIGAVTHDKRNDRFYACGFNSSAYYSEDGGNIWNRIKGYNFKWGQRVEPDPRDAEKIFILTFGGGVWHGPAKGDKQSPEDIITPVMAR